MKVKVPPIKSQGIKTKLVPWIDDIVSNDFDGRWVEPFMCDTNPHLINFYQSIKDGKIDSNIVREFLNKEGSLLLEKGESHYYELRERFNEKHNPLDFLFLNRAGFNGMIRFNRKGGFNIPFCRKPQRFAQAYVTKIVNQVAHVSQLLKEKDFEFKCQSFEDTIADTSSSDIIYCDPPYIGRHADYFNGWDEDKEKKLFNLLSETESKFILSTWHHNDFRENEYIHSLWSKFNILTREHFYHVGGSEKNRNPMIEAIVTNYSTMVLNNQEQEQQVACSV
jgi:DNA adenine methylase